MLGILYNLCRYSWQFDKISFQIGFIQGKHSNFLMAKEKPSHYTTYMMLTECYNNTSTTSEYTTSHPTIYMH